MFAKISEVFGGVKDKIENYAADKVVDVVRPLLAEEVEEHVNELRVSVESEVPRKINAQLEERRDSGSVVTRFVVKTISGRLDRLVDKTMILLKPHVDTATNKTSLTITDVAMDQLLKFLHLDDDVTPASEQQSRGMPSGESTDRGLGTKIGSLFNLEERLPRLPDEIRERIRPISDALKAKLWELTPIAFQEAVEQILGENEQETGTRSSVAASGAEVPVSGEVQDRGFLGDLAGKVMDKLNLSDDIVELVPKVVEYFREPVQQFINGQVQNLEDQCVKASYDKTRSTLTKMGLVRGDEPAGDTLAQ